MEIRITYVGTLNGKKAMTCGFKPEGMVVTEERQVLYPSEGKELFKDNQRYSSVWLKDGDLQSNYVEVDLLSEEEEVIEEGE